MEIQETSVQKHIGIKIKKLRKSQNMTALNLASIADISQGQLSKIETGKATVSIKNLTRICSVLDVPLSYLFQTDDAVHEKNQIITAVAGLENSGLQTFSRELSEQTNGAVVLKPLGPYQFETFAEQIKYGFKGNLDLFIDNIALFESIAPVLKHMILPYCFRSEANRQAFLRTTYFRQTVNNQLLENGIRLLNPSWNWMRGMEKVLVSRKPIISPEDIKGLRVRIYESDVLAEFWEQMGAIPVNILWSKVNDAWQNNSVDVVPSMKALLYHRGYCEYAKYVTLLGDLPSILGVFISEKKYHSFASTIQNLIKQSCDNAGDIFSRDVVLSETMNEKLNLSQFSSAYLKVDKLPWHIKTLKIRQEMITQGILPEETWQEMENAC